MRLGAHVQILPIGMSHEQNPPVLLRTTFQITFPHVQVTRHRTGLSMIGYQPEHAPWK